MYNSEKLESRIYRVSMTWAAGKGKFFTEHITHSDLSMRLCLIIRAINF